MTAPAIRPGGSGPAAWATATRRAWARSTGSTWTARCTGCYPRAIEHFTAGTQGAIVRITAESLIHGTAPAAGRSLLSGRHWATPSKPDLQAAAHIEI